MSSEGKNKKRLTPAQYVRKVDSQDRKKKEAMMYAQRILTVQQMAKPKRRTAKQRKMEERAEEQKDFLVFIAKEEMAKNKEAD